MITSGMMVSAVCELLRSEGLTPLVEYVLPNGRRLDVAAICKTGRLLGVEIKVTESDFNRDVKWADAMAQCFLFYFAVPLGFNHRLIHPGIRRIDCDGSRAWIAHNTATGLTRPSSWHEPRGRYAVNPAAGVDPMLKGAPGDSARARFWMP